MTSSNNVVYLGLRDILKAHARLFGITPEQAADHVRNMEGLLAVLARPKQYAHYEEADLALQGAVLSHGIAEGQLFVDGNKRTAAFSLLGFLQFNGYTLSCDAPALAVWIFCLSKGQTPEELAEKVRAALIHLP